MKGDISVDIEAGIEKKVGGNSKLSNPYNPILGAIQEGAGKPTTTSYE